MVDGQFLRTHGTGRLPGKSLRDITKRWPLNLHHSHYKTPIDCPVAKTLSNFLP